MVLLAHGFILTAMLWGGAVAFLIDRRIAAAATTLAACAVLAFFGFIHSVMPTGGIYLPWTVGSRRCRTTGRWRTSLFALTDRRALEDEGLSREPRGRALSVLSRSRRL